MGSDKTARPWGSFDLMVRPPALTERIIQWRALCFHFRPTIGLVLPRLIRYSYHTREPSRSGTFRPRRYKNPRHLPYLSPLTSSYEHISLSLGFFKHNSATSVDHGRYQRTRSYKPCDWCTPHQLQILVRGTHHPRPFELLRPPEPQATFPQCCSLTR